MKTGETTVLPRFRKTLRWGIPFLLMPLLVILGGWKLGERSWSERFPR